MDLQGAQNCLNESLALLRHGGSQDAFSECLVSLKELLDLSLNDVKVRVELATSDVIPSTLQVLVNEIDPRNSQLEDVSLYYRVLRGVIIVLRILVVSSETTLNVNLVFEAIASLFEKAISADYNIENSFFAGCFAAYCELLANGSSRFGGQLQVDPAAFTRLIPTDGLLMVKKCKELALPFDQFIAHSLANNGSIGVLLLHPDCLHLLEYISSVNLHESQILLPLIDEILCHEKFHKWIISLAHDELKVQFLTIAQLAITCNTDWNNHQCVTILSWALDLVKESATPAIQLLEAQVYDPDYLNTLHGVLVCSVDILVHLGQYNCAQQFFLQYEALEAIIPLFRAIFENVEVITAKGLKESNEAAPDAKRFPVVRSLLLELMAFICHSSFEAQEKIRELHGLELVLSSCVIDDNNPFMKEKATLCLKFLLEKNQKNQQFVAELEANEVADGSALEAAGYELNVVDGKLEVKNKA